MTGNVVQSPALTVAVPAPFRHAGGQRFLLRDVADAEQHLFVVPGAAGEIKELLWLQFEEYLPGVPGTYDYDADATVSRDGVSFFANVRRYTEPPQSGSDRERAFALLANGGYRAHELSSRVRLVHIPTETRRSEVMIIYAVPSSGKAELTAEQSQALIERALGRISLSRR